MYLGVTSHHNAQRVASYADARAVLTKAMLTPTGKQRKEKPNGFHLGLSRNHGVTWVRQNEDESIAFQLYDTDVVTWLPDDSILIDNFGTVTTSGFASRFLPAGITLRYPVERRGEVGGNKTICYRTSTEGHWSNARVCEGSLVHFLPQDGVWLPDESTCDTMRFPELDRKASRGIGKRFRLDEFKVWLSMATPMLNLEHEGWDVDECADALTKGEFRRAAVHLPIISETRGFGNRDVKALPIRTGSWQDHVTLGSVDKLRLALWDREDVLGEIEVTTIASDEFERRMARVREMKALDIDAAWDMGPTR